MRGKSYSIPVGMVFKKYYCIKCGCVLRKERIHRIVSQNDCDYENYNEEDTYPRYDYDVYSYRFKCPNCHNRVTYYEQCVFDRIQRKNNEKIISKSVISENFSEEEKKMNKIDSIIYKIIYYFFGALSSVFVYLFAEDDNKLYVSIVIFIIFVIFDIINIINSRKRSSLINSEKIKLMNKLHTYSSNNRELISQSDKCYCFYCMSEVAPDEITEWIDERRTAVCPKCGIDSILPDKIDEKLNQSVIREMNDYWF